MDHGRPGDEGWRLGIWGSSRFRRHRGGPRVLFKWHRFLQADTGEVWRIVWLRNPWRAKPQREWKGEWSDDWLGCTLHFDHAGSDGLSYMCYETGLDRLRDFGTQYGATWPAGRSALVETPREPTPSRASAIEKPFRQMPKNMPGQILGVAGSATSITSILKVVETDLATKLAKEKTEKAEAQDSYEAVTQENTITKA